MRSPSPPPAATTGWPRIVTAGSGHPAAPDPWHPVWNRELNLADEDRAHAAADRYARALGRLAQRTAEPLSLSVKLPFCAAHCFCCDRPVHAAQPAEVIERYVSTLVDEARLLASEAGGGRDILQLHLGGGTVNEFTESQLVRIVMALQSAWRLPADAEKSMECDPRRASFGLLELMRGLGFDRVIFGVLDFDAEVQRAIGRHHSPELIDDACETARASGFAVIDLDVMVGLPCQTPARWHHTLQRVIAMGPERITLTRYRHRPWHAVGQQAIDPADLPPAETTQEMATMAARAFEQAGYRWIGADKFVLENDDLSLAHDEGRLRRSLVSYTAAAPSAMLGLGAGALGQVDGSLFWNAGGLDDWRAAVRAGRLPVVRARVADEADERRHRAAERLLCTQELPADVLQDGLEAAWRQLASYQGDGLVRVLDDRIVVTERGRHDLLALCAEIAEPARLG